MTEEFDRMKVRTYVREHAVVMNDFDIVGLMLLPEEYRYDCLYSMNVTWDQWAECTLKCKHGEYTAVSDLLHISEAIIRASVKFRKEHPFTDADGNTLESGDDRHNAWKVTQ